MLCWFVCTCMVGGLGVVVAVYCGCDVDLFCFGACSFYWFGLFGLLIAF